MAALTHRPNDQGAVTIEAAIALCTLVVLLGMLIAAGSLFIDQLKCVDAAREAARLVARGEQGTARQAVDAIAPAGAQLTITIVDDKIDVRVSTNPLNQLLPQVQVSASAYAVAEPEILAGPTDQVSGPDE